MKNLYIRKYKDSDLDSVIDIWLEASIKAHDFVDPKFWEDKVDEMRNIYIPKSETWIYEDNKEVLGFFLYMVIRWLLYLLNQSIKAKVSEVN